ncbi:MAG: carboxymuconolactone decarboxylase family protein [Nanobdellota archaeon]
MGEIKDYLNDQGENMKKLKEATPESMKGFHEFMTAVEKDGALDGKTKELIAVALSVKAQCHWCISIHVKNCLDKGATKEEILESSWVAALMGGGPSLMYVKLVQDAIDELSR